MQWSSMQESSINPHASTSCTDIQNLGLCWKGEKGDRNSVGLEGPADSTVARAGCAGRAPMTVAQGWPLTAAFKLVKSGREPVVGSTILLLPLPLAGHLHLAVTTTALAS